MTKKEKVFIDEYMVDFNGTQAAIRAGYSPKTAGVIANENLKKPKIKMEIEKRLADRSKRTGITAERVLMEYAKIAFLVPSNVVDLKTGEIKEGATEEDLSAIASVKVKKVSGESADTEEREVKFANKIQALNVLYKYLGMDVIKIDIKSEEQSAAMNNISSILEQMQKAQSSDIAGDKNE